MDVVVSPGTEVGQQAQPDEANVPKEMDIHQFRSGVIAKEPANASILEQLVLKNAIEAYLLSQATAFYDEGTGSPANIGVQVFNRNVLPCVSGIFCFMSVIIGYENYIRIMF